MEAFIEKFEAEGSDLKSSGVTIYRAK